MAPPTILSGSFLFSRTTKAMGPTLGGSATNFATSLSSQQRANDAPCIETLAHQAEPHGLITQLLGARADGSS